MATLPSAITQLASTAGALASGTDLIAVLAPVRTLDDETPRQFGGAKAIVDAHDYCEGAEYVALHARDTRKPVLFVGLPIVTPGVIGRHDTSGNTGTATSTVTAGGGGCMGEHGGRLTVINGGTVGTDQIVLGLSMDDGWTVKPIRFGTGNSYTEPFFNVTIALGAGDLTAGETIHTWAGTSPLSDAAGWTAARTALAANLRLFRTALLIGDLQSDTEADAFVDEWDAYETENQRFTRARASVYDRLPEAAFSRESVSMTGAPTLTFANVVDADTITRSAGSWISDGFQVGDAIEVSGSASNNIYEIVAVVTETVLTFDAATTIVNEGPVAGCTVRGYGTLTFAEAGDSDTITRSRGSWLADGFRVGDVVTLLGTNQDQTLEGGIVTLTETVLTLGAADDLAAVVIGTVGDPNGSEAFVTITAGQTKAVWMAEITEEFESIDARMRIDLSAGRGRERSPLTGWYMRRPAAWAASIREYQHDVHVATWRKSDGPVGFDLNDEDGNLVEWDDFVDGGAGSAARFTTLRTWPNGPRGSFIALSLTRESDGSILSHSAKVDVTNLACTIVQLNSENAAVGQDLILNDDGTAASDSLSTIAAAVNRALELGLLQNAKNEGPRASKAVWTPSTTDIFTVPEPVLTGTLELILNGTVHTVNTTVRVAGA
jgi:hypothetical protein